MKLIEALIALAAVSKLFDKWATLFAVEYHKWKVKTNDEEYKRAMDLAITGDTRDLQRTLGKLSDD